MSFFKKDDLNRDVELNRYAIKVFSNDELLREKLDLYIQTPKKLDLYFEAAKKFFEAGEYKSIKYVPTWSWWAFFNGSLFFYYRKLYSQGHLVLGAEIANDFLTYKNNLAGEVGKVAIGTLAAKYAKFYVIARFARLLNEQNDELLKSEGGIPKNFWPLFLMGVALSFAICFFAILFMDDI